jgi:hypothetical protein
MSKLESKERVLRVAREKCQLTKKDEHIRIMSDILGQILKEQKAWNNVTQSLRKNNFHKYYIQQSYSSI